jgi:excisionase family DNA binding protein
MNDASPYRTVPDVAAELRVSRHAVYRWVAEGRLEPVRVGNRLRFTDAAIDRFVKSGARRAR